MISMTIFRDQFSLLVFKIFSVRSSELVFAFLWFHSPVIYFDRINKYLVVTLGLLQSFSFDGSIFFSILQHFLKSLFYFLTYFRLYENLVGVERNGTMYKVNWGWLLENGVLCTKCPK